jgi:hypothetical protein
MVKKTGETWEEIKYGSSSPVTVPTVIRLILILLIII